MDIENIVVACVQKKQQSEIDARGWGYTEFISATA